MLEIVCDVLERASAKLPGWLASMNHNGELDVNHATRRQALALREAAADALPLIDRIRREHVAPLDHTADLPDAAVAPYREDIEAAHRALDALADSLHWLASTIRIAGMETPAPTLETGQLNPSGLQVQRSAPTKIVLDYYCGKLPPVLGRTVRQLFNIGALR